jgi:hypothetical protein
MSRILRRPMFRGGPASSDGVGITSGLNTPKRGFVDGPGGYAGEGKEREDITTEDIFKPYNLIGDSSRLLSNLSEQGYNYGIRPILNAPKLASNYIFGTNFEQTPEIDLNKEIIKNLSEEKIQSIRAEKQKNKNLNITNLSPKSNEGTKFNEEEKIKTQTLPTLGEDIDTYTKLLMDNAGPDKDEYTRQKYLTLAKFGLNLLKPTPVGIKPSLATSLASAAEKPLEEYGNISMQQSKEDRALRQAAAQMAFQKHMPGTIAKNVQDIMASNPNITAEEALSIATTGKNAAAIAKEKFNEIIQRQKDIEELANKDEALKKISKINPNLITDYAKIAVEQGLYNSELKGYYKDYNKLREGSIYFAEDKQTGELIPHKFIKGKLYSIREPEFKQKGI